MTDQKPVNEFKLQGVLEEDPKIHEGTYNSFGNFVIRFACIKKDEFGLFKCSTPHATAIDKLREAKAGDGIKVHGLINEDHYTYQNNPVKTKKLFVEELWVMKASGAAPVTAPESKPVASQPTDHREGMDAPPQTEADVPSGDQQGEQWK